MENRDEAEHTGTLHVHYAQARDDQYDYEHEDYFRSTSPHVVYYTDHEASLISAKLKNEETFTLAASILKTWLENGECTKKNSSSLFSMMQSTYNHVKKLQVEKVKNEEQFKESKKMIEKQLEDIVRQFTEIEKIYKAASLPRCWDQFTETQRKYIKMWKKQIEELKNADMEEVINEREDEEMELTDDENDISKVAEQLLSQDKDHIQKLEEETDCLKCQLSAAQNELVCTSAEYEEELKQKNNAISQIYSALQISKIEVVTLSEKHSEIETELKELRAFKSRITGERNEDNDFSRGNDMDASSSNINLENYARLISVITPFLSVHPFGANIDYICSYLKNIDASVTVRDVENLLKRFPNLYKEESSGIGASLRKKWRFIGY